MNDFFALLLYIAFVLGGLYYVQQGRRLNRQLAASRAWPTAQGVVLNSETKKRITSPGNKIRDSHVFHALIQYRYEVAGTHYTSEVVELGGRLRATPVQIQQQVSRYPSGTAVTVYYDPSDPSRACLLREGPGGWMSIIGGGGFVLLGAYLMLVELTT